MPEATTWGSPGRALPGDPICSCPGNGLRVPSQGPHVMKSAHHEHPCCCAVSDSTRNAPSSRQPIETATFATRKETVESPEPVREQGVKKLTLQEGPVPACLDSSSQPRPTETGRALDPRPLHRAQRTAQPLERACTRPRGNQRSCQAEQDRAKPARGFEEPSVSPPKSSVQHALGEV